MMTTKPKIRRVYVTATDADTRKSLRGTLYDTTPDQVLKLVGISREPIGSGGRSAKRRSSKSE